MKKDGLCALPTGLGVPEMFLKPKAKIKKSTLSGIYQKCKHMFRLLAFAQLGANIFQ